jgi:hypothetical protein
MTGPFTEPAACRFLGKAAVPVAGATEFCALARADGAQRANEDCRFPPPGERRAPVALPAGADDGAPTALTGANERSMAPEAAAARPGATWAHVARDGANDAAPPGVDPPFSPRAPAAPTTVSHRAQVGEMATRASAGNASGPNPETLAHGNGRLETPPSAGQLAHRAQDVLVARRGVDGRGVDALVPGEALDEPDVARGPVGVRERRVPERVEVEDAVEAGALLPQPEEVAERPGGDALPTARDEERRAGVEALPAVALPPRELAELVPDAVRQEDLLRRGLVARPLEGAQGDAPADASVVVQDVADVERGELVLAQPGPEREREDDVVAEAVPVLSGDPEQAGLLDLGQRAGRAMAAA